VFECFWFGCFWFACALLVASWFGVLWMLLSASLDCFFEDSCTCSTLGYYYPQVLMLLSASLAKYFGSVLVIAASEMTVSSCEKS
jgi:hypothetical protein